MSIDNKTLAAKLRKAVKAVGYDSKSVSVTKEGFHTVNVHIYNERAAFAVGSIAAKLRFEFCDRENPGSPMILVHHSYNKTEAA